MRPALFILAILVALPLAVGCDDDLGTEPDAGPDADQPDAHAEPDAHQPDAEEPDVEEPEPRQWPDAREGCNGHPDLCDRPFHQVVFPATHNSMGNDEDGWWVPNQNYNMRTQLIDGIRVFLIDTYDEDGEILLCHAHCELGSRPLLEAMEEFRSFLEENPDEILTIIFEDHITGDQTVEVLENAGLVPYVYTHDDDAGWPTLAEMIDAGTRLVVTNESAGPPPAWMHHVWDLGWDTPYTFGDLDEFNCDHNRGTTDGDLFLINHWVLDPFPSTQTAQVSNSYETLMARVDECEQEFGRLPTFLAVDFHDIGDLFEVVDVLNGVASPR